MLENDKEVTENLFLNIEQKSKEKCLSDSDKMIWVEDADPEEVRQLLKIL